MAITAQKRALKNYRSRLERRGMGRFEVLGLNRDRELIRALAKKLAEDGAQAEHIRSQVEQSVSVAPAKGGILAALRRSPLVGAELNIVRPAETGRKIDL